MSVKSQADLAEAVLREMGVIDALESPAGEDSDYVISIYQDKYAELSAPGKEYAYWRVDAIPHAIFLTVRDLVINECSGAFGEPTPPETKDQRENIILKRLRSHVSTKASGLPARAEYF